eukprot:2155858-Pleurochrysis_carterae.AAC.3
MATFQSVCAAVNHQFKRVDGTSGLMYKPLNRFCRLLKYQSRGLDAEKPHKGARAFGHERTRASI